MLKKSLLAIASFALAAPAFADHGYREYRRDHFGYVRPYVVQRPVVVHEYYRPRPVIVREYYQPAPQPAVVYRTSHPDAGAAILFGALLGAVVAHQIATH